MLTLSFVEFEPVAALGKSFKTGTKRYARSVRYAGPLRSAEHSLELWRSRTRFCQPMLRSVALLEEGNGGAIFQGA